MISETKVREQFRRLKPLKEISVAQHGWTLDVLNIVRRLPLKVGDEVTSLKLKTGKGLSLLTSSPTREFTPSPASWENCIRATAMSATKSACSFKSCVMRAF